MNKESILNSKNFIIVFVAYLFISSIQYFGNEFIVIAISACSLLLCLLNFRLGVTLLILLLFAFDDLPYNLKNDTFYSIHRGVVIGGQTITKLISIALIFLGIYAYSKKQVLPKTHSLIYVVLTLFVIGFLRGALIGNLTYVSEFINDCRFYLNFFIGFFISILLFKENQYRTTFFELLSLIFIAKSLTIIVVNIFFYKGNVVSDTTFYFSGFFALFLLHKVFYEKKRKKFLIFGISMIILSLGLAASRGKLLVFFIALISFLLISKKIKYLPHILLGICVVGIIIYYSNPYSFHYLKWKLTSFIPDKTKGRSSMVRFIEIKNILQYSKTSISDFLFGKGFGSYFTTQKHQFPFEIEGTSSYPIHWIRKDKFFKPHGPFITMLLKNGIGGVIFLYTSLTGYLITSAFKYKKETKIGLVFMACLIPTFLISYSAKQNLFAGVLFGLFNCYVQNPSRIKPNVAG